MYDALDVARYIIFYELAHGRATTNLRLQKLLYFVQAAFIAATPDKSPCFTDKVEAWGYGPVVPLVYFEYSRYGAEPIPVKEMASSMFHSEDLAIINTMLDQCGALSARDMVEITKQQDPWMDVYSPDSQNEITVDDMRRYFGDIK